MSTPENSGLSEGLLIASDMKQSQTGSMLCTDESSAEGASAFANQSGDSKPAASTDPAQSPRPRGKLEIPVPNTGSTTSRVAGTNSWTWLSP